MNKLISLALVSTVLLMAGCSLAEPLAEAPQATPTIVANGSAGTVDTINDVKALPVPEEERDLRPTIPRVKQAQVIGVVRELVRSGCVVEKVATTDGIHYSQLVVTCGEPQAAPAIQ